jgi:hypothetical protein
VLSRSHGTTDSFFYDGCDNVRVANATTGEGSPLVKAANMEKWGKRHLPGRRFVNLVETYGTSRTVRSYLTSAKIFTP